MCLKTDHIFAICRLRLKCDGTRAETRSRLSPKRMSPFKSAGTSVQSTAGSRGVRISVSNAGYTMFRGSVKSTGYPLHSPVSPSLPLPCVTVCHQVSNALYQWFPCISVFCLVLYFDVLVNMHFQALAITCVALHYHSPAWGSSFHEMMIIGAAFGGYIVILVGILTGIFTGQPVNKRIVRT